MTTNLVAGDSNGLVVVLALATPGGGGDVVTNNLTFWINNTQPGPIGEPLK